MYRLHGFPGRPAPGGVDPSGLQGGFLAAASLFALAAIGSVDDAEQAQQFRIGDVTMHRGSRDAASNCLRSQAELMIAPYLKDRFSFRGV